MTVSKLFVGNLNYSTTNANLEELFSQYGTVQSVNIIGDKGFGFVEMSSAAEAQEAKDNLDGTEYMGRTLKVDEAHPPKQRNDRGGGGGKSRGGFGGRRW